MSRSINVFLISAFLLITSAGLKAQVQARDTIGPSPKDVIYYMELIGHKNGKRFMHPWGNKEDSKQELKQQKFRAKMPQKVHIKLGHAPGVDDIASNTFLLSEGMRDTEPYTQRSKDDSILLGLGQFEDANQLFFAEVVFEYADGRKSIPKYSDVR